MTRNISARLRRMVREDTRGWRLLIAAGVYALATLVFFVCAAPATLHQHTPWNHFALLAEAWQKGRLDLGGPPPEYAGYNDFAHYQGKWFVAFPPFPAVLVLPLVMVAGAPTRVQDGQFFLWLAGIAPAVLFLCLERLRQTEQSNRTVSVNALLALLLAWGTVYFFTAEQGTVWYAAHVVGAALAACYLRFALRAEHPILAGAMLGLGWLTRPPLLGAMPLLVMEAWRVHRQDRRVLSRKLLLFALPIAVAVIISSAYNLARFGAPWESGYRYLTVVWQARMNKWGLFSYHYLARNLGVVLTSLPYMAASSSAAPFQINSHGLALWVTSPFFLWLLWPRRHHPLELALWLTVAGVALPTLLYQNTGWVQFGYRFSNDYSVFLFALLAIGGHPFGRAFSAMATWAVVVNLFGALSFGRPSFAPYYFTEPTQKTLYQPD